MTERSNAQFKESVKQSESSTALHSWQMDQKETEKRSSNTVQPIKILKRQPNSDPCLVTAPARVTPNRHIKTLEEREAAYAEARLRILGPVSRTDCDALPNGHQSHSSPRNPSAAKFPVESNIKIISNTIRQNTNTKT